MAEERYLCPQCSTRSMVRRPSEPGWHILVCEVCGAQRGPMRERRPIDVA